MTDSSSGSRNKSLVGGEFYQSTDIPALTNTYIMCDYNRGHIFAVHREDQSAFQMVDPVAVGNDAALDDVGIEETTLGGVFAFGTYQASVQLLGAEAGITAMLPIPSTGEMLLADNSIIRKIAFDPADFDSQLPQTLTATGAFTDVANFELNPEMDPYEVNQSFWSDGALKSRFLNMVEASEPIQYSQDGPWQFPAGTVTMKHFEMDLDRDNPGTNIKRIETRFLIQTEDTYYGMTYQWNPEGTEATLVDEDGVNIVLPITEGGSTHNQDWRIPSRAECYQCHTSGNGVMLGMNTRQLNHDGELAGSSGNFLQLLESAGYLSPIGSDPSTLPKYSLPSDISVNLEERVKSYLAVNCSYCHYEGSSLVPSSWSGEHALSIEDTHLLHGEAIGFQIIDESDRLVIPGDPANSIILSRASATNGYGCMPPLASNVIDTEGVNLLTDWINHYANAKPTFDGITDVVAVPENSSAGVSFLATDADDSESGRGELSYSIVAGNGEGYFDIDSATGQITFNGGGLDYEEATSHQLVVKASDGFAANPGETEATVTINVEDLVNDDSQGDGIADEWAVDWFGTSSINPAADSDGDGSVELLEYWADTNPTERNNEGFVLNPVEAIIEVGNEGYVYEWEIRSELVMGVDYRVQGSNDLVSFEDLDGAGEMELISKTPVEGEQVSRVRVKVPTTSDRHFLRLGNLSPF